jgi:HK97 family phage prohead protease
MKNNFCTQLELKAITDEGTFTGFASVYDIIDSDNDIIRAGAFTESLGRRKVKMLWQHRQDKPIGLFTNVRESGNTLEVEGQLNLKTRLGAEAYELLKQGAIDGLSVGFMTKESEYDNESRTRIITKAELYETSLVTFPANEAAKIFAIKSFNELAPKEIEAKLRDEFDLSREQAKAFMAKGYSAVSQREVDNQEDDSQRDAGEQLKSELLGAANAIEVRNLIDKLRKLI